MADTDHAAEDDIEFFHRRPYARTRIRAPFPGEFPRKLLRRAQVRELVVLVAIERDANGQPMRRGRGVYFTDGGSA